MLFEQCLASRGVVLPGAELPRDWRTAFEFNCAHPGVGLLFWRLVGGGIERDDAWAKAWFWKFHSYSVGGDDAEVEFDPFEERQPAEVPVVSQFVEVVLSSLFGVCEQRREASKQRGQKEFLQALWQLLLEFDKLRDYDDSVGQGHDGYWNDVCVEDTYSFYE
jgi:hypothetical protein